MRIPTKYTNFPFSNIPYNRKKSWTPSYFYPLLRIWFFTFKKGRKKKKCPSNERRAYRVDRTCRIEKGWKICLKEKNFIFLRLERNAAIVSMHSLHLSLRQTERVCCNFECLLLATAERSQGIKVVFQWSLKNLHVPPSLPRSTRNTVACTCFKDRRG